MYLRLLTGRLAGQVHDVAITAARAMLADGRAELENPQPTAAEPAALSPAPPASTTEPGKPAGSAVHAGNPAAHKSAAKAPAKTLSVHAGAVATHKRAAKPHKGRRR